MVINIKLFHSKSKSFSERMACCEQQPFVSTTKNCCLQSLCNSWIIFSHSPCGGSNFFCQCAAAATTASAMTVISSITLQAATMDMIRILRKKDEQLDLGGDGKLGKPMSPASSFKTRLCLSFVASGCQLAYGKVELRRPDASSEVQDQVVLMLFVMIVCLLFCRNA